MFPMWAIWIEKKNPKHFSLKRKLDANVLKGRSAPVQPFPPRRRPRSPRERGLHSLLLETSWETPLPVSHGSSVHRPSARCILMCQRCINTLQSVPPLLRVCSLLVFFALETTEAWIYGVLWRSGCTKVTWNIQMFSLRCLRRRKQEHETTILFVCWMDPVSPPSWNTTVFTDTLKIGPIVSWFCCSSSVLTPNRLSLKLLQLVFFYV